jgi:hypothetical protein
MFSEITNPKRYTNEARDATERHLPKPTETWRDLRMYKPLIYTRVCFEIVNRKP